MSNKEEIKDQVIEGHSYDGIEEFDNPLPRWWLYGFYLTIVFAFAYVLYYHYGPGPSLSEAYTKKVAALEERRGAVQATGVEASALLAAASDESAVEQGRALYSATCAACHGDQGQGIIGPNLTDGYWLHGGKPEEIYVTVRDGVLDKGMPPWGSSFGDEQLTQLTAYILSVQGSNPPGAKEPQGEPVETSATVE